MGCSAGVQQNTTVTDIIQKPSLGEARRLDKNPSDRKSQMMTLFLVHLGFMKRL